MTNSVLFLSEIEGAKRRLTERFESETLRSGNHQSTAISARDRSYAARTNVEKKNNAFPEYRRKRTPVDTRIRPAIPTTRSGETGQDTTVSTFLLVVVLVSVVVAGLTDRPVFWLLIVPTPLVLLYSLRALLQLRVIRWEGLLTLCKREYQETLLTENTNPTGGSAQTFRCESNSKHPHF